MSMKKKTQPDRVRKLEKNGLCESVSLKARTHKINALVGRAASSIASCTTGLSALWRSVKSVAADAPTPASIAPRPAPAKIKLDPLKSKPHFTNLNIDLAYATEVF